MKDFFLKDSVLKVISFIVAVLLWVYIISVVDPSVDITVRDIPIRYTNQNLLEEKGLCLISDSKATVELKISGSRKRVANIDNKNIYATVDLTTISKTGTFSLPIAISIPYEYDEIVSKKPYNASVVIDKIVSAERDVKVVTTGNTANGYIAGSAVPSVKTVSLTGPATMIERIGSIGAEIDYDGRSAEINDTARLFFLDKEGKRIASSNEIYSLVEKSVEETEVKCTVYKLKTVPVKVDARALDGISNYKISAQPSNVTIYAENAVLEKIEEIKTEIINLDGMAEDTQEVKLVIPEGVSFRDGITKVNVKAEKRG
ncbi:MAG: hypothetical protein IKW62_04180 [Clostridia bacterium]|nr:hypothetical protein [Clostridia bacterium]